MVFPRTKSWSSPNGHYQINYGMYRFLNLNNQVSIKYNEIMWTYVVLNTLSEFYHVDIILVTFHRLLILLIETLSQFVLDNEWPNDRPYNAL